MIQNNVTVFTGNRQEFSEEQVRDIAHVSAQISNGTPPVIEIDNWVIDVNASSRCLTFFDPKLPEAVHNHRFIPRTTREYVRFVRYMNRK